MFCSDVNVVCDLEIIFLQLWNSYSICVDVLFEYQSPRCVISM